MKNAVYTFVLVIALFVICTMAVNYHVHRGISVIPMMPTETGSVFNWRPWILGLAMLVGIFAGHLYPRLNQLEHHSVLTIFRQALKSNVLWGAIIACPLVYAVVYVLAKDQPDSIISATLAFENGFFCQTIIDTKHKEKAATPTNNAKKKASKKK